MRKLRKNYGNHVIRNEGQIERILFRENSIST